jgi:NADH-quinone oxidoreductase subunit F/NADP-reducing hydrogenase subunit HndC
MDVIRKSEDLYKIFETEKIKILNRTGEELNGKKEILVCAGTGCLSSKSGNIIENLNIALKEKGLDDIEVHGTGCFGFCEKGPIVKIMPDDTFYAKVTPEDAGKIVESHLVNGKVYGRRLYKNPQTKEKHELSRDIPFYKKQKRIALHNCGLINAEKIEEYIGARGYQALDKVLNTMSPKQVIDVIKKSGLRGRGGGGFPTGIKWSFAASSEADKKYVICNADEGDPGAFMDRSILEGDPHSIIEAMIINAFAIGSNQGYVYVRAEYPVAVMRLEKAIVQAKMYGLLGENILGTAFNFDLEIRLGAGAFVCGEETALIASIEGERGMPRNKPPFPAVRGLWDKPSNVNNVETYANIPKIILNGADWYAAYGTENSKGTKVFALGGKVNNTGLIEVPMGTTLKEAIFDIGGGILNGRKFKAVQTGGPSGGCLVESHLDTQIDYDNLTARGSMMGSGGMIVMDEDNCMVDVARFYLDFSVEESCGKCAPCREGTHRLLEILNRICDGKGEMKDLDKLEEMSTMVKDSSLCGLGQTAPNPILSTLKYFKHEYESHINGSCPAGVCSALTKFEITDVCNGCGKCAKNCPVDCIEGDKKELHTINQDLCIVCGACKKACPVEAIVTV